MRSPLLAAVAVLAVLSVNRGVAAEPAVVKPGPSHSSYLELRIYKSLEGQRDRFLSYFEEHYLESQEATGMRIWGQFHDLGTPSQFVWLRGYRDMESRAQPG